jgi:hypothetical protein
MGRATVREAVRAFMQAGVEDKTLPVLSTVYAHPPKLNNEQDFYSAQLPGVTEGAVMYMHMEQSERRASFGGAPAGAGMKRRHHDVTLMLYVVGTDPQAQTTDAAADELVDAIVDRVQGDRQLGCGSNGPVWQAGEGDEGSPDLLVQVWLPRPLSQGATVVFALVRFTVIEYVQV